MSRRQSRQTVSESFKLGQSLVTTPPAFHFKANTNNWEVLLSHLQNLHNLGIKKRSLTRQTRFWHKFSRRRLLKNGGFSVAVFMKFGHWTIEPWHKRWKSFPQTVCKMKAFHFQHLLWIRNIFVRELRFISSKNKSVKSRYSFTFHPSHLII